VPVPRRSAGTAPTYPRRRPSRAETAALAGAPETKHQSKPVRDRAVRSLSTSSSGPQPIFFLCCSIEHRGVRTFLLIWTSLFSTSTTHFPSPALEGVDEFRKASQLPPTANSFRLRQGSLSIICHHLQQPPPPILRARLCKTSL
jgi:hypothetical protein